MKDKGCAADFIGDLQWADLPEATRRRVKLCLLDGLGVALAGTMTEVSKIAAAGMSTTKHTRPVVHGDRLPGDMPPVLPPWGL